MGALNAVGAAQLAAVIGPRIAIGSTWLVSIAPEASVVDRQTISWGQNIAWDDNIVWGDALYKNRDSWASNIV